MRSHLLHSDNRSLSENPPFLPERGIPDVRAELLEAIKEDMDLIQGLLDTVNDPQRNKEALTEFITTVINNRSLLRSIFGEVLMNSNQYHYLLQIALSTMIIDSETFADLEITMDSRDEDDDLQPAHQVH